MLRGKEKQEENMNGGALILHQLDLSQGLEAYHQAAGGQLGEGHGRRGGETVAGPGELQHHRIHELQ